MLPMVHTLVMYAFLMVQPQSQVVLLVCEMAAGAAHHHLMMILTQPSSQVVLLVVGPKLANTTKNKGLNAWSSIPLT